MSPVLGTDKPARPFLDCVHSKKTGLHMKRRITPTRIILHLVAAFLLCGNAAAATPVDAARFETVFNEAMELYSVGRWSAAYGRFAALADQGHAESARIALLMLRYGSRLYGRDWGASQPQINQWMALAPLRMQPMKAESGD